MRNLFLASTGGTCAFTTRISLSPFRCFRLLLWQLWLVQNPLVYLHGRHPTLPSAIAHNAYIQQILEESKSRMESSLKQIKHIKSSLHASPNKSSIQVRNSPSSVTVCRALFQTTRLSISLCCVSLTAAAACEWTASPLLPPTATLLLLVRSTACLMGSAVMQSWTQGFIGACSIRWSPAASESLSYTTPLCARQTCAACRIGLTSRLQTSAAAAVSERTFTAAPRFCCTHRQRWCVLMLRGVSGSPNSPHPPRWKAFQLLIQVICEYILYLVFTINTTID